MRRHVRLSWWVPVLIALWWVVAMGLGCVSPPAQTRPNPPVRQTVFIEYHPAIGRLVVPSTYDGGVLFCVQDGMNLNRAACMRLADLRKALEALRYAVVLDPSKPAGDPEKLPERAPVPF